MSKGLLIHNPKAGSHDAELIPQLTSALGGAEDITFEELGKPEDLPARIRSAGYSWVAVAGGDGTVEAIASALIDTGIPLGVIAAGTYNNFARSLDLPLDPLEACAVITSGNARPIDVAFANGHPFFESLGAGLDAALYPMGEEIKSGKLHRLLDFFKRAYGYRHQVFTITLDRPLNEALTCDHPNSSRRLLKRLRKISSNEITLKALMLTVSNGPYFGMNFAVAPDQLMDDGQVTVTIFSRYSKLQLWWHFASIAFGRREYHPKSIAFRGKTLQITGPRRLPVHLDGTPQEDLWPLQVECRQGALTVFRPS